MTDRCFVFTSGRVSAPCEKCSVYDPEPHVIGATVFCKGCCPFHNPTFAEKPIGPISGVQVGGLFE